MARAPRLNFPDAVYHVTSRGNGRARIVCADDERTIDRCVAERYGIDPEQLKQHGRRAGIAKAVAVELSCTLTGERARTVALHYGGISSSAVGNIRRKVREGQFDIRSDLDHLLPRIRTAHAESTATARKV